MADAPSGSPMPIQIDQGVGHHSGHTGTQKKRNQRHKKNDPQHPNQFDDTFSDSVTGAIGPAASPRSKKPQNKQKQTTGPRGVPAQNGNMASVQKPRPVSVAGPMLPGTPGPKEQAYAGPTFHASPAPSSLPVPRFFSRSVPNNAGKPSLQARLASEKAVEKEESSPEPDVVVPADREAVHSPLDLFFQADRIEKERSRNSSTTLSPEMAVRRPPATEPRNPFQQSGKSIFLRELDGQNEDMPSPRTAPTNSRPTPPRLHSSPGPGYTYPNDEAQREAQTQSLKAMLFNTVPQSPQASPPPTSYAQPRAQSGVQNFHTPSPFNRPTARPTTPAGTAEQQNHYLHYGNQRNLSPLFKAARNETPTRPSSLRQEFQNGNNANAFSQHPQQAPSTDPNSFSRDYLNQQIRDHSTPSLPQLPVMNGAPGRPAASGPVSFSGPYPQGVQANSTGSVASPRAGGSQDISTMEDDLRRMLKLQDVNNVAG